MKMDLGFGNSICVREAFLETYPGHMVIFSSEGLSRFDYPDRYGDPELVVITKQIIKRQVGLEYKHVFITNGATGAIAITLRAYKQRGAMYCYTRNAPWYLRYPSIINASGVTHCNETYQTLSNESVILLDIPNNPLGITTIPTFNGTAPVVFDGVYFNNVYTSGEPISIPNHDVFVASYSKLTGLNGLRVGWIATNDDFLAERIKDLLVGEYSGISVASTEIIKSTLLNFDWNTFEDKAKRYLDSNRTEWQKLEKYFGNMKVPNNGMFHYGPIDKKCKKLLEKSDITWTTGSSLGTDDSFGRFNLGQSCELVQRAVKTVLKNDRLK